MGGKGGLPEIELVATDEGTADSETAVTSRPRPNGVLAVAAVVALLVVVAVVARGQDDDGSEAQSPSRSTPSSSTTSAAVVAPGSPDGSEGLAEHGFYLGGAAGPLLDEALPGSLLLVSETGNWRQVDLSTGWVASLADPALAGVDPRSVIPVRGGVVFAAADAATFRFLPIADVGPEVDAHPVPVLFQPDVSGQAGLGEYANILATGGEDRLWVHTISRSPGQPPEHQATLVDLDGRRLHGPFPVHAAPTAGSEHGVLFNAGGSGFLVDANGTTDLGAGEIYAAAGSYVGRVVCDGSAQCHPQVVHLTEPADSAQAGPPIPTATAASQSLTMSVDNDGSLATLAAPIQHAGTEPVSGQTTPLYVAGRGRQPKSVIVDNARSAPVWLPDGKGLLVLTGNGLVRYTASDGSLLASTMPDLRAEDASAVLLVPPGDPSSEAGPRP